MFYFGESAPASQLNSASVSKVNSFHAPLPHTPPTQQSIYQNSGKSDDSYEAFYGGIGPLNSKSMKRNVSIGVGLIQDLETSLLGDSDPIFQRHRKPVTHQIVPGKVDIELGYSTSMMNDSGGNLLDVDASLEVRNDSDPWKRNDYSFDNLVGKGASSSIFISCSDMIASSIHTTASTISSNDHNSMMFAQTSPLGGISNHQPKQKPTTTTSISNRIRSDLMASSIQAMVSTSSHDNHNNHNNAMLVKMRSQLSQSEKIPHNDPPTKQRKQKPRSKSITSASTLSSHGQDTRSSDSVRIDKTVKSTILGTTHSTSCLPFLDGIFSLQRKDSSVRSTVDSRHHQITQSKLKSEKYTQYGQFL